MDEARPQSPQKTTSNSSLRSAPPRSAPLLGSQVAGFACEMAFSPSGKFLVSGDGNGKLFFWDWNTTKSYARFNAHTRGPTMSCEWSPVDPSLVATCGWDGCIKFWSNTK